MTQQIDRSAPIEGTYIFNGQRSRKGYNLNCLSFSLTSPENRELFKASEEDYMEKYNLTDEEKQLIRDRDWLGIIKAGGNIYMLIKLGAVVGHGLYPMGAQQRGQTYEEFLNSRNVKEAR